MALYGDQTAFGGGSGNSGIGHANGGGASSSSDSGSDSDRSGGGGVGPENGSSGGGVDEVTASQVCTLASLRLQSRLMRFSICCVTYILGQRQEVGG
jgi:hypothetical protein